MDADNELTVIQREYESYFSKCAFVPASTQKAYYPLRSSPSHLHIVTKEGNNIQVTVSVAGWGLVGDRTLFLTFEALMNRESPAFCRTFADNLSQKLLALQ